MANIVSENNDYHNAMANAICYWLGYQFKIGREPLIHEASLRYPIADTITAKGVKINRIVLEKLHPIFKQKYIDLVIFDETVIEPEAEKNDTKLKEVYEFKLAKIETSKKHQAEHQRIFNDIVRLAYYHFWSNKECYFLMCGSYEDFKTYFVGQKSEPIKQGSKNIVPLRQKIATQQSEDNSNSKQIDEEELWKPEGLYKDWFGFKVDDEKPIIFDKTTTPNFGLKQFQVKYKTNKSRKYKFEDTFMIKTKCVAITNTKTHAAGIWKIESIKDKQ